MNTRCGPACLCDCCLGIEPSTPRSLANRQGLPSLRYRVGAHGDFLASMLARLANMPVPKGEPLSVAAGVLGRILTGQSTPLHLPPEHPLAALTARTPDDPAIALLDAWAVVLDVLTFYQERIANENYLTTATEFRSVLELARLVGYKPRPGVAAATQLAFTLEKGSELMVKAGNRAQSVPGAGQQPQSFETADDFFARERWNNLVPRRARPQLFDAGLTTPGRRVWFQGLATQLKPNDPLVLVFDTASGEPFRAKSINPAQTTLVVLQEFSPQPLVKSNAAAASAGQQVTTMSRLAFELASSLFGPKSIAAIRILSAVDNVFSELKSRYQAAGADAAKRTAALTAATVSLQSRADIFTLLTEQKDLHAPFKAVLDGMKLLTNALDLASVLDKTTALTLAFETAMGAPVDRTSLLFQIAVELDRLQAQFAAKSPEVQLRLLSGSLKALRAAGDRASWPPPFDRLLSVAIAYGEIIEDQLLVNRVFSDVQALARGIDVGTELNKAIDDSLKGLKDGATVAVSPIELANTTLKASREVSTSIEKARLTGAFPDDDKSVPLLDVLNRFSFYTVLSVLRPILSRFLTAQLAGVDIDTQLARGATERCAMLVDKFLSPRVLLRDLLSEALTAFRALFVKHGDNPLAFEPLKTFIDAMEAILTKIPAGQEPDEATQQAISDAISVFQRNTEAYHDALADLDAALKAFDDATADTTLNKKSEALLQVLMPPTIGNALLIQEGKNIFNAFTDLINVTQATVQTLQAISAMASSEFVQTKLLDLLTPNDAAIADIRDFATTTWPTPLDGVETHTRGAHALAQQYSPVLPRIETLTEDILPNVHNIVAGLRQDRRIAEAGSYPRVLPWLQELLEELERFLSDLSLQPQQKTTDGNSAAKTVALPDLSKLKLPPARVPASSARLARRLPSAATSGAAGQAFPDLAPQLAVALDHRLAGTMYDALENIKVFRRQRFQGLFALRARASVFGHNAPPRQITGPNGATTPLGDWPLTSDSVDVQVMLTNDLTFLKAVIEVRLTDTAGIPYFVRFETTDNSKKYGTSDANRIELARLDTSLTVTVKGAIARVLVVTIVRGDIKFDVNDKLLGDKSLTITGVEDRVASDERGYLSISFVTRPKTRLQIVRVRAADVDAKNLNILTLDSLQDKIIKGSFVVIERPPSSGESPLVARVESVTQVSPNAFGLPATKVTRLTLDRQWLNGKKDHTVADIRDVNVYVQSEKLELAGEPYDADVGTSTIELDDVVDGLTSGRWLIVAGERTDVPGTTGVKAAELMMLQNASQIVDSESTVGQGFPHTQIMFASALAYSYQRGTVTIYGNVVKADQGETKQEIVGSGDAKLANQRFVLKQSPLTCVAAPTPEGAKDTLQIRVDGVLWQEASSFLQRGPNDACYVLRTDYLGKTTVQFGDGVRGARLPSGVDNVRATYRAGMGRAGNVEAGKISQLVSRPLGLKEVVNPLAASGGADRESTDHARKNAPLGVTALGRLVAVSDYADFAHGFAGIEKAYAARLTGGISPLVHLTIAGRDGDEIAEHSDLYRNFVDALRRQGDPALSVQVAARRLSFLVMSAKLRVLPTYEFDPVAAAVRARLYDAFSFERREFGQAVILSDVIGVMHSVRGVQAVDVDAFDLIDEKQEDGTPTSLAEIIDALKKIAGDEAAKPQLPVPTTYRNGKAIVPAGIAFLSSALADLLILNEWKP